jgi:hypothetical protein
MLEDDGTVRQRAWSLAGTGRRLLLDIRHRRLDPKERDSGKPIGAYVTCAVQDSEGASWAIATAGSGSAATPGG